MSTTEIDTRVVVPEAPPKKHDPVEPVATREELEELLLAGLASGEPRPATRN